MYWAGFWLLFFLIPFQQLIFAASVLFDGRDGAKKFSGRDVDR
ncbi:hypothetical protein B4099_2186 [Heyndrickxia coagulans]|uniref:Uncharacterized protein n=1 Tax=Heyndrickxia coagulans TaxID=1398 RepID=A0A150JWM7_HEYCO|nr:hypothetical protein B4099_2186 [Heyndrickxia coagulans]